MPFAKSLDEARARKDPSIKKKTHMDAYLNLVKKNKYGKKVDSMHKNQRKRKFSLADKLNYYQGRTDNKKLSKAQREFAKQRLKSLKKQEKDVMNFSFKDNKHSAKKADYMKEIDRGVYTYTPEQERHNTKGLKPSQFADLFKTLRHMSSVLGFKVNPTKSGYSVKRNGKTVFINIKDKMPARHGFKVKETKKKDVYALNIAKDEVNRYQSIRDAIENV